MLVFLDSSGRVSSVAKVVDDLRSHNLADRYVDWLGTNYLDGTLCGSLRVCNHTPHKVDVVRCLGAGFLVSIGQKVVKAGPKDHLALCAGEAG